MKLTTRGHYSVKALLDLMINPSETPTSHRVISARQGIPEPYLEQLLVKLRKAGLIQSVRGAQGGYRLAKLPRDISLGAILRAVGEHQALIEKLTPDPDQSVDWVTQTLWRKLGARMAQVLDQISLEDLYHDARSHQAAQSKDQHGDFTI